MRIEQVTLTHLRMKLQGAFETSFSSIATRDSILIEAKADGITGLGECVADYAPGYCYETTGTAWHILENFIVPSVIGIEIEHPSDYYHHVKAIRGHNLAKAGMEMALWDIYGKQRNKSLRKMIGGIQDQVSVGVSIGIQSSPQALIEQAAAYLDKGYQRIKIKIKPGRDVQDTELLRNRYPYLDLQVDANSAYTLKTVHALTPLDELDLLLIEQPLAEDDIWDHSKIQSQFKTPICLDESIHSVRHTRQAIEMKAAKIINIKPGRVGGITQAVAIHDLCGEYGIPVWCGGMLETGVGRAANLAVASLPNFTLPGDISATERYYQEDITQEIFTLNDDSTITVPDLPGLGVTLNQDAVARAALKKETFDL